MRKLNPTPIKYYWIEFSEDAAELLSKTCRLVANLEAGNLTVLETLLLSAIERREGREPNEHETERIREVCKALQFEVFDSTFGKTKNIHRISDVGDALCDMSEVINYKFRMDGREEYKDAAYPCGWCDTIPMIRILREKTSSTDRRKQPKIYK